MPACLPTILPSSLQHFFCSNVITLFRSHQCLHNRLYTLLLLLLLFFESTKIWKNISLQKPMRRVPPCWGEGYGWFWQVEAHKQYLKNPALLFLSPRSSEEHSSSTSHLTSILVCTCCRRYYSGCAYEGSVRICCCDDDKDVCCAKAATLSGASQHWGEIKIAIL